ncbi:hypothetical protein ABNF97_24155 [Plantactinospora sp. B6F1]|uniref:hypothetical protein n=1 Tax=Plantactinospora sp. B6F1 TaxID=3158971 RepID=UPI0032D939BC
MPRDRIRDRLGQREKLRSYRTVEIRGNDLLRQGRAGDVPGSTRAVGAVTSILAAGAGVASVVPTGSVPARRAGPLPRFPVTPALVGTATVGTVGTSRPEALPGSAPAVPVRPAETATVAITRTVPVRTSEAAFPASAVEPTTTRVVAEAPPGATLVRAARRSATVVTAASAFTAGPPVRASPVAALAPVTTVPPVVAVAGATRVATAPSVVAPPVVAVAGATAIATTPSVVTEAGPGAAPEATALAPVATTPIVTTGATAPTLVATTAPIVTTGVTPVAAAGTSGLAAPALVSGTATTRVTVAPPVVSEVTAP